MKWRSLEESAPGTDTRSLRDIFAERKELIAKYVPPDIQAVHARVIGELEESRFAKNVLQVGSKAPVFELKDHNGTPRSSADLLTRGRLVICFFRGRWCPFCVGQLEAMNLVLPQIEQAGASLVGNLTADGSAVILHGGPAQAALSLAERCRKPGRATVWAGLSRAGRPARPSTGAPSSICRSPMAMTVGNCPSRPLSSLTAMARFFTRSGDEDYTRRPEPQEILRQLSTRP